MTVEGLLSNYEGKVDFYNTTTDKIVCATTGDSPIVDILSDYEVVNWAAVKSTANPRIAVFCKFTEPEPTPEPDPEPTPDPEPDPEPEDDTTEGE